MGRVHLVVSDGTIACGLRKAKGKSKYKDDVTCCACNGGNYDPEEDLSEADRDIYRRLGLLERGE